jgi:hypothetical protein
MPKRANYALVSGVDFLIKVVKVSQPFHRQAVFVFFAIDVHFHQMHGKPLTHPWPRNGLQERRICSARDQRVE